MEPVVFRRCQALFTIALTVLTIGVGYCVIVGTCLVDFLVVIAGLLIGWVAVLYCVGMQILAK